MSNNPYEDIFAHEEQQAHEVRAAHQRAEEHRAHALHLLMEHKSGRMFVRDFLNFCGVFASPSLKTNEHAHFAEGLRLAGMYVFSAMVKHDADSIRKIFNEEGQV